MTVNLDIFPRQALTAGDFKTLGRSIRRWLRLHAKQQGSVYWYDSNSLAALLKGRPPLAALASSTAGNFRKNAAEPASALGTEAGSSGVAMLDGDDAAPPPFGLDLVYNKIIEDRQILANVRRALSTALVADVLINGRSWDNPARD